MFVAYVNDIDTNLRTVTVLNYEYGIKVYPTIKKINYMHYRYILQSNLDTTWKWICDWQLKLEVGKCVTMHFRRKNPIFTYSIRNTTLGSLRVSVI